jgi:transposase-like protein
VPWKVDSVVEARQAFINDWLQRKHHMAFSAICAEHGITRQLGYKWVERFREGGLANLVDRSRAPIHRPQATPSEAVDAIVALRKRFPQFGPRKLRVTLEQQHPRVQWPSPSTIGELLKARGLVTERKRRRRTPRSTQPLAAATAPNIVWSADFKGCFKVAGRWCHPLTITDNASRYLLAVRGVQAEREELVGPLFERAFHDFGLPWRIRTDNVAQPPRATLDEQEQAFDEFRAHYNEERPHEAIGQKTPASVYVRSARPMPEELPELDYPDDFVVRRVHSNGNLKWNRSFLCLGRVLATEAVGAEPIADGLWHLWFGPVYLGELREKRKGENEFIANRT